MRDLKSQPEDGYATARPQLRLHTITASSESRLDTSFKHDESSLQDTNERNGVVSFDTTANASVVVRNLEKDPDVDNQPVGEGKDRRHPKPWIKTAQPSMRTHHVDKLANIRHYRLNTSNMSPR